MDRSVEISDMRGMGALSVDLLCILFPWNKLFLMNNSNHRTNLVLNHCSHYCRNVFLHNINRIAQFSPSLHLPTRQPGQFQMHPFHRLTRQGPSKRNLLPRRLQFKSKQSQNPRNGTSELRLRKIPPTPPRPMKESNLRKISRRPTVLVRRLFPVLIGVDPSFTRN